MLTSSRAETPEQSSHWAWLLGIAALSPLAGFFGAVVGRGFAEQIGQCHPIDPPSGSIIACDAEDTLGAVIIGGMIGLALLGVIAVVLRVRRAGGERRLIAREAGGLAVVAVLAQAFLHWWMAANSIGGLSLTVVAWYLLMIGLIVGVTLAGRTFAVLLTALVVVLATLAVKQYASALVFTAPAAILTVCASLAIVLAAPPRQQSERMHLES